MKLLSIFLLLLLVTIQECQSQQLKHGYIRQRKVNSFQQIFDLKKGCLLVMLHSNLNKINALHGLGNHTEAERIQRLQLSKNMGIVKAFRDNYDFCPVYFFSNSDAIKLLEYGIDSVTLLDDNLTPDTSIHIHSEKYFVSEFGMLQGDTAKYFSGYNITGTDSGLKKTPAYYTNSSHSYRAFTMQSDQLIQLKKPFPYFIVINETEDRILVVDDVVSKLNRRLKDFLEKAGNKILNKRFEPYFRKKVPGTY